MSTLKESEFPGHADYVRELRTCVIKSKRNVGDLQMGYLLNSGFVEGLAHDSVRGRYIVEVLSKWRPRRPFGFDTLVQTIAEAYIAAGYQLEKVLHTSRSSRDTAGASTAVSRPLPMVVPPTSTLVAFPSNAMPTPLINPMPTPSAAPMPSSVLEPMNLNSIAKLREELHTYIGERRGDRSNSHDIRETGRCYNYGEQGHLARDCQKNRPPSTGREVRGSRFGTP